MAVPPPPGALPGGRWLGAPGLAVLAVGAALAVLYTLGDPPLPASPLFGFLASRDCSAYMHPALAALLWLSLTVWMFLAVAIVCDDFFVASLEVISEALHLSEDVAGATFMAAGSSAPELFTSVAGAFFVEDVANDNAGPGTIVGSAVFNVSVIVGASVLFARTSLPLDWYPLTRDSLCYGISVLAFIATLSWVTPARIDWWEGLALMGLYSGYIGLMVYNRAIRRRLGLDPPGEVVDDVPMVGLVDPIPLVDSADSEVIEHIAEVPSSTFDASDACAIPLEARPDRKRWYQRVVKVLAAPFALLFRCTIPDCRTERWRRWYALSFAMCIFWIGLISYLMVEFAIHLGRCLAVGTNVMGLTILAAGTSVPDALASIAVARQGKGDMAVSNALGSNIFDILLGLGLPWFLSALLVRREALPFNTHGLPFFAAMLLGVVALFLGLVGSQKWVLRVWHGYVLLAAYVLFVVASVVVDHFERLL